MPIANSLINNQDLRLVTETKLVNFHEKTKTLCMGD